MVRETVYPSTFKFYETIYTFNNNKLYNYENI